ncbi:MAG: hypothetical protein AAGK71_10605 [Pseudomonadota bacterium]
MATIIDNTLPGAKPQKITQPYVIWIASVLAGPIFGAYWLYRNAQYLGCHDVKRQGQVLLIAVLFCAPMLALIDFIKDSFDTGSFERLGNHMLLNVVLLVLIVVPGYCYNRQCKMFHLHAAEIGQKPLRLNRAVLFVLAAWAVTFLLLATFPPLGEAMGGLALFLS